MLDLLPSALDSLWNQTEITFAQPWETPFLVPAGKRDDYEIYLMERGSGLFSVGGHAFPMEKNDLIFLRTDQENRFEAAPGEPDFRFLLVTFALHGSCDKKEALDERLRSAGALCFRPEDPAPLSALLYSLQRAMSLRPAETQLELKLLLGQLALRLREAFFRQPDSAGRSIPGRNASAYVDRTVSFLQEHYAEPLTLGEIAAEAGLNPRYLSTLYSRRTGRSIWDTLTLIRLDHARRLLLATDLPVTQIAMDTGFGDAAYFSRSFRNSEGLSPREYRRLRKNEYNPSII